MSRPRPRSPSVAVAMAVLLVAVALPVVAAGAHPAGEVPRARLAVEGNEVVLDWIAAPDDAAEVLVAAGIWPEEVATRYLDVAFGLPADPLPRPEEIRAASRDPSLPGYLTDHLVLEQGARTCPGTVHPTEDLLSDGVRISFRCPTPPAQVRLTISLLHDRDPSYRTFSLDGTRRVAIHTAAEPTHPWDLADPAPAPAVLALFLGAALGAAGIAGLALARLWRVR